MSADSAPPAIGRGERTEDPRTSLPDEWLDELTRRYFAATAAGPVDVERILAGVLRESSRSGTGLVSFTPPGEWARSSGRRDTFLLRVASVVGFSVLLAVLGIGLLQPAREARAASLPADPRSAGAVVSSEFVVTWDLNTSRCGEPLEERPPLSGVSMRLCQRYDPVFWSGAVELANQTESPAIIWLDLAQAGTRERQVPRMLPTRLGSGWARVPARSTVFVSSPARTRSWDENCVELVTRYSHVEFWDVADSSFASCARLSDL
jgi:hypothetical protein